MTLLVMCLLLPLDASGSRVPARHEDAAIELLDAVDDVALLEEVVALGHGAMPALDDESRAPLSHKRRVPDRETHAVVAIGALHHTHASPHLGVEGARSLHAPPRL